MDHTGKTYGILSALHRIPNSGGKWLCRCACGTEKAVDGGNLSRYKSCGCEQKSVKPGEKYGRLTVISYLTGGKWRFLCECGNEKIAMATVVKRGATSSCGCYGRESRSMRARKHGHSFSPTWTTWMGMTQRCTNPKRTQWPYYGGRGIKVCERWLKFENFLADMGVRPSKAHSIDRIDSNGHYEPGNCRWALKAQQASNTRANRFIEWNGERHTMFEWARKTGLPWRRIQARLNRGWTAERTLTTPV